MRYLTVASSLLLTAGCLRTPIPSPVDAAVLTDTASPPPTPFAVVGWSVRDRSNQPWSPDAAPRSPVIQLELSQAPKIEAGEEPPFWLFAGAPDEDLRDDLSSAPLRLATRERIVPASVALDRRAWVLTPRARLLPGSLYAVAVAPWLRSAATDERLSELWAAALAISDAPEAGAEVTASWPADGTAAVPSSLSELALRFDGPVDGVVEGVSLFEGERRRNETFAPVRCVEVGWADGWCARSTPTSALARGAAHRVFVSETVIDVTGAPVGPWAARFTTALEPNSGRPRLLPSVCNVDATEHDVGCLFADDGGFELIVTTDQPARLRLAIADRELLAVAPRGVATLSMNGLPPDTELSGMLRIENAAGLETLHPVVVATLPPLPAIAIVEVRSDPRGREPSQEYVEVLNFGAVAQDLAGFTLSDRADALGDAIARSAPLAPGQRALLVADAFDPDDPADVTVPPGVMLVRIGRSLATGGLINAGEPLFLRDAAGHRLSASPALAALEPGQCIVRVGAAMRAGEAENFVAGPCTPGTAP